jgi:putative DNA primase/helicase
MISEISSYENGREKIHELSRDYPRYNFDEVEKKINHFLSSGTGPMLCSNIAEKGFVCPRIGECRCKSPAGLPFTMEKVELQIPEWYRQDSKTKSLTFMPGILAQYLATNRPAVYSSGMFYFYKDGYYKEISDISAQKIVQDHLIIDKSKMADIRDATEQWRLMIEEDVNKINANRSLINLQNGLYNIKTKELMPHSREVLSTIRVNASYTPGAECPKFLAFLNEVLEPELIPLIRQMIGYCLTLSTDSQKAFMMRGVARSGKSTIIKLIEHLVGEENCSNIPLQDLSERFKTAALFGRLINSFSDLPNKSITESGVFKAIVSGDLITGERKGKDPFSFRAFCKLLYSANELPFNAGDKTDGFFRRLIIIRFIKQIPEEDVNPNLLDELLTETDGILMWALEGLQQLIKNRFRFEEPAAVKEELSRYRYMSNNAMAFVEDSCVVGLDYRVERQEFYDAYCKCCSSNGTHPMAMSKFTALIESDYHDRIVKSNDSVSRRGIWKGIKLKDETDTAISEVKDIYDNFLPF